MADVRRTEFNNINYSEKGKSLRLNMLLNGIRGIMGVLFPLITFPYVTRVLGVDNLGRYNFAISIISYFILLSGLGIYTYAVREGARLRDNKMAFKQFADEIFSINVISTVISFVLLIVLIYIIPKFAQYRVLLIILSIQLVFKTIGIEWLYSIFEDYAFITIRSILFQVLSLFLLFLIVNNQNDINNYAFITVISATGSGLLNFYHAKKYCRIKFTPQIKWDIHLKPIMILFALAFTVTIYVSSDITILGFMCDDYTVGIYSVSVKIYTIIKALISSVLIVSIPRLSALSGKNSKDDFKEVSENIYKTLITLLLPVSVGLIILRKQVILIISSKLYIDATFSLALLGVALICSFGSYFWGQCILVPLKKESTVFKATMFSALLNIILNLLLVPMWQEKAAAFTTILAEGVAFVWCAIEGNKIVKLSGLKTLILKVVIGCFGIVFVALALDFFNLNTIVYTSLTVTLSIIVYLIVELVLKNEIIIKISRGIIKNVPK